MHGSTFSFILSRLEFVQMFLEEILYRDQISSGKSIRTSSQKPHPRKMLHLEPWDKALLTGGDCKISHFQYSRDSDQEELSSFEIVPNSKKMSEAEPIPPASSVTTLLDDWSIEIDADHVDLGQDGLGVFARSEEAEMHQLLLSLL
ncbi:hypothetical protein Tco_0973192 [Tanacetum coccineum]